MAISFGKQVFMNPMPSCKRFGNKAIFKELAGLMKLLCFARSRSGYAINPLAAKDNLALVHIEHAEKPGSVMNGAKIR